MQKITSENIRWMKEALRLAKLGEGRVHPNPMVGAVAVKNGRVAGRGHHEAFGQAHAEVNALRSAPDGCDLYVSLEPCSHFGKTPPCADLLVRRRIRRVFIAMTDPNPIVRGQGVARLKKAGIPVVVGLLEKEARALNRAYLHWIQFKKPYVTLKLGQSLDGCIATKSGQSQWITSAESRKKVQELRSQADAVLVGINTLLVDDPLLSCRHPGSSHQPIKVILDAQLKTPVKARIFSAKSPGKTILFTSASSPRFKRQKLGRVAEVLTVAESAPGHLSWDDVLKDLGKKGIAHLLIEGGGQIAADALRYRVVQELCLFVAPIIIGGRDAKRAFAGEGISRLAKAPRLKNVSYEKFGEDLLVRGEL